MANAVTNIGPATPVPTAHVPEPAPKAQSHPAVPAVATPALVPGGKASPTTGQRLPVADTTPPAEGDAIQLQSVVQGVNQYLRDNQRKILFQFDPQTDKESVTIVNPATGEVIRQIPASTALATAAALTQTGSLSAGLFIDENT
jgi:uncharacterized FlaG/YvyC family protein